MLNRMMFFLLPFLGFLSAITGIVVVGQLLLFTAHQFERYGEVGLLAAPLVALVLVLLIAGVAALLAVRAEKLPPVQWPDPGPTQPVRRLDLGAGYIVGQFVFFFGLGLLLLFAVLVLKR